MQGTPLEFQTENQQLAYILAQLGETFGIQNLYSRKRLTELDCPGARSAVERAKRSSKPSQYAGRRIYTFHQSERLQRLLSAFDEGKRAAASDQPLDLRGEVDEEMAARMFGFFLTNGSVFGKKWMEVTPGYMEWHKGDVSEVKTAKGEIIKTFPGLLVIPASATEEQQRHVGL